jgi:glutaminyl-tRNA synthetase
VEVRLYGHLFTTEEPSDANWEAELNPESEVVVKTALVDPSLLRWAPAAEKHFQFERLGFFVVDSDSVLDSASPEKSRFVFNLTVNLKDSKPKTAGGATRSRKDEQAKQLADKMVGAVSF